MSIYKNDSVVAEITRSLTSSGKRVFQIFQRGTQEEHVKFLLNEFSPPSGLVLDIGCGVGEVARIMKNERPDLDFILLNISPYQLSVCPPFKRICANGERLPLADASVDSVMACYSIGHMNKELVLDEIRRVLKPGGVLFIADMTGGEMDGLDYVAYDWDGYQPDGMNIDDFSSLMPDFSSKFPKINPVIVRKVYA